LAASTDGDFFTPTAVDLTIENHNTGLDLIRERTITGMQIYMVEGFSDVKNEVTWEIYTSLDGLNWSLISPLPIVQFNLFRHRYEIIFPSPIRVRFIKAVNTSRSLSAQARVTEMEVTIPIPAQPRKKITETSFDRDDWSISSSLRITEDLTLSGNTFFQQMENQPADVVNTERSFSLNLSYFPTKYLSSNLGWSRIESEEDSPQESFSSETSSYFLTLGSEPLETLESSLSFNLSENEEDSTLISRTFSSFFHLLGEPYDGIEVGMSYGWSRTKNFEVDSRSTTNSLLWELNLRPKDWIVWGNSLSLTWSKFEQMGTRRTKTTNVRTDITLTPSPVFTLRVNYETTMSAGSTTSFLFLQSSLSPSRKIQYSISYNRFETDGQVRYNIAPSLFWRMSRSTDLVIAYDYVKMTQTGDYSQSIGFRLNIRF